MAEHDKIIGYRNLSDAEVELINEVKKHGVALGALIDRLSTDKTVDVRWLAIGRTALQQGLMALARAVAKPDSF